MGDHVHVYSEGQMKCSAIINITLEMKRGWMAPLTIEGTMLVNDVLVSCFASVTSHHWAQWFFLPFRFVYRVSQSMSIRDPFDVNNHRGIHWLFSLLYRSLYLLPFRRFFLL